MKKNWLFEHFLIRDITVASTVTVPEGMLVLGGWNPGWISGGIYYKSVYLLKNEFWSFVGNLSEPVSDSTVFRMSEWIILVSGDSDNNFVERFKWNEEQIKELEIIGENQNTILNPIVFGSSRNFCKTV